MPQMYSGWQNGFRARLDATLISQDITNNTSYVELTGYIESQSGWWFTNASISATTWIAGGNVAAWSEGRTIGSGGAVAVIRSQHTITHNADGSRAANVSVNVVANNLITFNQWAGGDWVLPTIPRATTPNWTGDFIIGSAKTINLPRANSGFTHKLYYGFGDGSWSTITTDAGTSYSWTPPLSLLTGMPNAASRTGTLGVHTYNGSTLIGVKDTAFTLIAPSTAIPTVTAVNWSDTNSTIATNIGAFVQGLSLIQGVVSGAGYMGSTITARSLLLGSTETVQAESVPFRVDGSGVITAKGKVTDSRGRTATLDSNFNVLPYSIPSVSALNIYRVNSAGVQTHTGGYLRVDLTYSASSLIVASTEKNSTTITVKTRANGTTTWVLRNTINNALTYNSNFLISGGETFLPTTSYDVRIEVSDKAGGQYIAETTISTGIVTLDMNGAVVGIGKFNERGALDVAGDVYAEKISADADLIAGGYVYSRGANVAPTGIIQAFAGSTIPTGWLLCDGSAISRVTYAALYTIIGTTYGTGDGSTTFNLPNVKGRVIVGYDSTQTEFNTLGKTAGAKTHTLTEAQMPSHKHAGVDGWIVQSGSYGGAAMANITTGGGGYMLGSTGSAGSSQAHNNLQPSIALHYIIKT